jgi:hypothetical protein
MGIPKHAKDVKRSPATQSHPNPEQRFLELLDGIHSFAEAEELLDLGILADGTRTKVLKHLAAHMIWFKNNSTEDAATFLIEWAMNPQPFQH